ncbi:T9SS type A sorting domain-containing protein [Salisaeta longa]|uniref:T9SS type A sorting domain-containing protein n=1 Tax=Salisaeta longa TaxID=503170 RepID=UPI0003B71E22|nr:T9SS type A sorting domain-containing protein [Salisaeta longa]
MSRQIIIPKIVLYLLGFAILFPIPSAFAQTSITEDIVTDTEWTQAGSPYIVESSISVDAGATLTVQSGVVVEIDFQEDIVVRGALVADDVTFEGNDTDLTADESGTLTITNSRFPSDSGNYVRVKLYSTSASTLNGNTFDGVRPLFERLGAPASTVSSNAFSNADAQFVYADDTGTTAEVTADATMRTYQGLPVKIVETVIVDAAATLTVQSGVVVQIDFLEDIVVRGALVADDVTFEGNDTDLTADESGTLTITNSRFSEMRLYFQGTSTGSVNNNDFLSSSSTYALENDGTNIIDAENNYWGSANGPTHPGNPGGNGLQVSDNVDYEPWLQSSPSAFAAPNGLTATSSDGQVDLSWTASTAADLDGYNVYRATSSFSDPANATKLNSTAIADPFFTDNSVTNGTTYFYGVTAVDADGNESGLSNEASATPSPGGISETLEIGAVTLYADAIENTSGSVYEATGNVSINEILQFSGTVTADTEALSIAGDGSIFVTEIPSLGNVVLYEGAFDFNLADEITTTLEGEALSATNSLLTAASLPVHVGEIELLSDGVRIGGEIVLPDVIGSVEVAVETLQITRSSGFDIAGTLSVEEVPFRNGIATLESLELTFDSAENRFSGAADLKTPALGLEAEAELLDGLLNTVAVEIEVSPPVPIANTGLGLSGGGGGIENIVEPPPTLFVSADITPMTGTIETVTLDDLTLAYTFGERLEGSGRVTVFDEDVGGAVVTVETQSLAFEGDASFTVRDNNILDGQISAGINQVSTGYDVSGGVSAQLQVPSLGDGFPFGWLESLPEVELPYTVAQTENYLLNAAITGEVEIASFGVAYGLAYVNPTIEADFARNMENLNEDLFPVPALKPSLAKQQENRFEGQSLILGGNQQLNAQARATADTIRQQFTLNTIQSGLIIRVDGSGEVPSFSVTLPNGRTVSASDASAEITFSEESGSGKAFATFGAPTTGMWSVNLPSGPEVAVDVIGANPAPSLDLDPPEVSGDNVSLSWTVQDNDPVTVDLFYDTDSGGQDGTLIAEDVSGTSYTWPTTGLTPGPYYIYARASDGINSPAIRYASTPVQVAPRNELTVPTDLDAAVRDTVLDISWSASPDAVTYTLFYEEGEEVNFTSPSLPVGDTTGITLDEIPSGRTYTLAVVARDDDGGYSALSLPQTVNYTRNSGNNPPKFVDPTPPETSREGESYSYTFAANDADNDPLSFSLLEAPDGMMISSSGVVSWTSVPGVHNVRVQVADNAGGLDSLSYILRVTNEKSSQAHLSFGASRYIGSDALGTVTLSDFEQNVSSTRVDSVDLTVQSVTDEVDLRLYETGANTATFAAAFSFSNSADHPTLSVQAFDTLRVEYADSFPVEVVEARALYERQLAPVAPEGIITDRGSQQVTLSWSENVEADLKGYFVYRAESPFSDASNAVRLNDEVISTPGYADTDVNSGITYYYRVAAVDDEGNESALSAQTSVFLYPETVEASITRTFGDASGPEDYRLVALPGSDEVPLASSLGEEAGTDWQAYWDDGSASDFLIRYDGSNVFTFTPGRGFWLTSPEDWATSVSAPSITLRGDTVAVIDLHDGWNIIANPTDKDVEWTRVEAMHPDATLQSPWTFDGTFAQADTLASATTGKAYYFLNDAGLDSLAIPYPGAPFMGEMAPPVQAQRVATATLALTATRPNGVATTALISLSSAAATGPDPLDLVGPPTKFSPVSLRFVQPKSEENGVPARERMLAREWRPVPEQGHTFDIRLSSKSDSPLTFRLNGLDSLRFDHASLIHPEAGRSHDIEGRAVEVTVSEGTTRLQLAVGTPAYVTRQQEKVRPKKLRLRAYPNPARSVATLEYTLPEARPVQLVVYDVLGREVVRLVDGQQTAGRHQVQPPVERLASGMYFVRLRAGDRLLTRKLVIVQ